MGKSVCRGSSHGERERSRAHKTRRREEREKGARIFSGIQLLLPDTGRAQQIRVTREGR